MEDYKKIIDGFRLTNNNMRGKVIYDEADVARMRQVLATEEGIDYIITHLSAKRFYEICEMFDLPEEVIERRQEIERFVVNDKDEKNIEAIKESLSGLIYREIPHNALLLNETIKERADHDPEFKKIMERFDFIFELFEKTEILFNMKKGNEDWKKADECVSFILVCEDKMRSQGKSIYALIRSLKVKARADFKNEIRDKVITSSSKVTNGISPDKVEVNGVQIPLYRIQNQTEDQRNFAILARTCVVNDQDGRTLEEFYKNVIGDRAYVSYSLFNEHLANGYAGKYTITFGYTDIPDVTLLSANTHDG